MRSIPSQKDGSCYIVSLKENEINNTDKPWSQTQQAELIGAMNGLQIMLACCLNWVIFWCEKRKKNETSVNSNKTTVATSSQSIFQRLESDLCVPFQRFLWLLISTVNWKYPQQVAVKLIERSENSIFVKEPGKLLNLPFQWDTESNFVETVYRTNPVW